MSAPVVALMLALLLGIQPITTDLYLPALPTLGRELHAGVAAVQLTLSALIICFGIGQLVCGPLADRFGRRPVLLAGLGLYTVASVASAAAPSIAGLIGWRALQGAAMAAAVTCARSMLRDLFEPHEGARVMSRAAMGLGLIAMLSPLLGGVLVQWVSWRAALLVLSLFGAGTLAFVAWRFDETLRVRDPRATQLLPMLRNWRQVAAHPGFRAWTALLSFSYAALFLFLASSSFVFIDVLGASRIGCGLLMAGGCLAYIGGTLLCRRLLARGDLRRAVRIAAGFSLAGGGTMALLSLAGVHTLWAVALPQWIFAIGHGIHQPCAQAGAVGPFPDKAGTAAALSGFAMMLASFAVGLWFGAAFDGTVYPLTLGMGAMTAGIALVAWTLVQRHGHTPVLSSPQPA
jgi:DHA1 family bicyclomycin/chloramphenicol resistance-like MFS transporter